LQFDRNTCRVNAEEKTHQVIMMGDVYQNSSQVLIRLGEHELDEDRGGFLDDLAPTYKPPIRWGGLDEAYETITQHPGARTVPECYKMAFATLVLLANDVHINEMPFFPKEHFNREVSDEKMRHAIAVSVYNIPVSQLLQQPFHLRLAGRKITRIG
jgi:hypothetical protein